MHFTSLRIKFLTSAIAIMMLFSGLLLIFVKTSFPKKLEKELQKSGVIIAKDLAQESAKYLLSENRVELKLIVNQHKKLIDYSKYIFIIDRRGKIIAHTFKEGFPVALKGINNVRPEKEYNALYINTKKEKILDIAVPILKGDIGVLRLGISEMFIMESVDNITRIIVYIIIGVLVFAVGITFILATAVTRPISKLTNGAKKIGSGDLEYKINVKSNDEIGQLAISFNKMTEDLKNITASRDELNKEIAERKRLEEELRALSLTDDLTGLKNRRGFFTLTEHLLKIARRQKQGIFMLYTDLDNLKEINDTLGHREGDNALIDIANILKASYRESDVVARIGGDEFVVIPIGTTKEHVGIVTARLQEKLDIHNAKNNRGYKLSVSIGITYYNPENPCSIDELLTQAEKLMYEQKRYKKKSLSLLSPTNQ